WTTRTTPLKFPATNAPATLDAYACYSVAHPKSTASFNLPAKVTLADGFGKVSVHPTAAIRLCVPTAKTALPSVAKPAFVNPDRYTVCFAAKATHDAAPRVVYDRNQYGIGAVRVARTTE